jgi:hypothetical protein
VLLARVSGDVRRDPAERVLRMSAPTIEDQHAQPLLFPAPRSCLAEATDRLSWRSGALAFGEKEGLAGMERWTRYQLGNVTPLDHERRSAAYAIARR